MKTENNMLNDLRSCFAFYGSKSGYIDKYPNTEPIFNAKVGLVDSDSMEIEIQHNMGGDIDLLDSFHMNKLIAFCRTNKQSIVIYRESTVNNCVFNGRLFPYMQFAMYMVYSNHADSIHVQFRDISSPQLINPNVLHGDSWHYTDDEALKLCVK
jgi:hypothetical protein